MFNINKDGYIVNKKNIKNKNGNYVSRCNQIRPVKNYDDQVKIPKIIFQTWKTYKVPEKWKVCQESINALMPNWKYVLFNDKDNRDFVEKYFPDFLPYYDAFPYNIQRADAIRYMFLYKNGGLYIDLDFEVLYSLAPLFLDDADVYLVHSGNLGSYVTNSFMASKPGAYLWLEMLDYMKTVSLPWYYMGKHIIVMNTTGPSALSYVIKNTASNYLCLSKSQVMPCSICEINTPKCNGCTAMLRPLEGCSWTGYDTAFYNFWLCNWRTVVAFVVSILILIIIAFIIRWTGISKDNLWPW